MAFPYGVNIRDAAARAFTDTNKIEQLDQSTITRVGKTADSIMDADSEITGVGYRNILRPPMNHQSTPLIEISVN